MATLPEFQELADFLEARFDEDDEVAGAEKGPPVTDDDGAYAKRWRPEMVLAETEARRRILEYASAIADASEDGDADGQFMLEILAAPYADHPDFDERWRQ